MKLKGGTITYANHSYIKFDCDAGLAKVNVSRGELLFIHNDISTGEGTFNMGISHIYTNFSHLDETSVGSKWKLNIQQYVKKYDGTILLEGFTTDDYVYVDGEGYVHRFVKFDNYRYIDQSGYGMILNVVASPVIEMSNGTTLYFSTEGYLNKITITGKRKKITRKIDYENGCIKKYYDERCIGQKERYYSFDYSKGLLNKISLVSEGKVLETIFYNYNDNKLKGIYHFVNNALESVSLFKYDNNNRLIFTTGTNNGIALGINYNSDFIEVKKGVSKVLKSSFSCLNDDVRVGEEYSYDYISPQIGFKETKTRKGAFVVDGLEDGIYYLGDEYAFESFEDELVLVNSYEAFDISNSNMFERTEFEYRNNHTNINSDKNIHYRYYYNQKGFVTGVFEVDGQNLMTLTKDSGIAMSATVSNSYENESINSKSVSVGPLNKFIRCLGYDCAENGFDDCGKLKSYRETIGRSNVNYTASFWMKILSASASYVNVSFQIYNNKRWISNDVYVDHTANGAWQYVTIPISIENDEKLYDFTNAVIVTKSDGVGSFEVSNLRLEEGTHSNLQITKKDLADDAPTLSDYSEVRLLLENGYTQTIVLNNQNYVTESDVFATCRNINKNNAFDFVYCANTKIIPNVIKVFFKIKDGKQTNIYSGEIELQNILNVKVKSLSPDESWCVVKCFEYKGDNLLESTYCNLTDEKLILYDMQGRILSEIDSRGKKTVNVYDDYGNIISTTTALKENFENDKIIAGKPRFYTRYNYDDESNDGMYREMVVNTTVQNSNIKVKKSTQMINNVESIQIGDNYAQKYDYDILNRIKEISINYDFGKVVGNCYEYDDCGHLKEIKDNDNYSFVLDYDQYGNIKKYNIKKSNGELITVKTKETIPNASTYGGDVQIENNHLTKTKITVNNDKYGRPIQSVYNNSTTKETVYYQYQDHNANINTNEYQSGLFESPSIGKIKNIIDECDNTKTTFLYDNKNEDCGYIINKSNKEIQRIQQMNSENTKYVLGDTKYKTTIEKDNNIHEPRIIKTSISWDDEDDGKDKWSELDKYTYTYQYDDVLGIPIAKINSHISIGLSYIPQDGTKYYSNQVQTCAIKVGKDQYKYSYQYDNNQNLTKITSNFNGDNNLVTYTYDKLNRLKNEYNQKCNANYDYSYLLNGKDIDRITKITMGNSVSKEYTYDDLNRLVKYKKNGLVRTELTYDINNLNPSKIKVNSFSYELNWSRNNLLTQYGNNYYTYNYQGNRVEKYTNNKNINYYYDGSKLLGEDYSTGEKIRYMYDLMGISGVRYITSSGISDYHYVKDGQGNIVAIVKDNEIVVEYCYDAWGNFVEEIKDKFDPFAKINPFRWKCNYYDIETNMYYINGRYYNPELCNYIDSLDVEDVVSSSSVIGGLNPYAICTDNPVDLGCADFTILTNTDLVSDPVYDPLIGYTWWEKNWKNVIRYGLFTITLVTSIVLMCIPGTQAFGIGMFQAGLGAALSGMVIGGLISGIISAIQGNGFFTGFADGAITGFVDGFTSGAIMYCVSSAISAISKTIKASNQTCSKPGQCFVAGTLVLTEYGYKAIEEIELGDKVWSWCEETGEKVLNKVTTLFRNKTTDLVHLSIAGEEITTTKGHPFYVVDYGWKDACELQPNDKVVMYNDTIVTVNSIEIEHLDQETKVYNFEVENAHTYYVTDKGILVHNDCISDELTKIANKYDDFKCVECADEMKKFLDAKGVKYKQIEIQYGPFKNGGIVYSDSLGRAVSYNGYHTGILYKGKVFDNLFKSGIKLNEWLDDLMGIGSKIVRGL